MLYFYVHVWLHNWHTSIFRHQSPHHSDSWPVTTTLYSLHFLSLLSCSIEQELEDLYIFVRVVSYVPHFQRFGSTTIACRECLDWDIILYLFVCTFCTYFGPSSLSVKATTQWDAPTSADTKKCSSLCHFKITLKNLLNKTQLCSCWFHVTASSFIKHILEDNSYNKIMFCFIFSWSFY